MKIKTYTIFESITQEESNISLKEDILELINSIESGDYNASDIHDTCDKVSEYTFSDPTVRNILCRKIRMYASDSKNSNLKSDIESTIGKLFKESSDLTEVKLNKQDCRLFSSTWELVSLLRDSKIQLQGDILIYNPNDDESVNILTKFINL
jgi:hypothetical protein